MSFNDVNTTEVRPNARDKKYPMNIMKSQSLSKQQSSSRLYEYVVVAAVGLVFFKEANDDEDTIKLPMNFHVSI